MNYNMNNVGTRPANKIAIHKIVNRQGVILSSGM